jgi:phenylpropionate dioxygenase-like ring-hydroxylating dioxygenase large terminal subunit
MTLAPSHAAPNAPLLLSSFSQTPLAPAAHDFPDWPAGWYVLADSAELNSLRPIAVEVIGRRLACYRRADDRRVVALDASCWHMGADLSQGRIVEYGRGIECPFHGWQFAPGGRCQHIPSQSSIPPDANVRSYPTAERAGRTFVFLGAVRPPFPLPFFDGVEPADLIAARPFELHVTCPWWIVGTNGFDVQHFAGAHERRLVAVPRVGTPHPAARRIFATFDVCGRHWRDRLTRRFSGSRVTMDVTMWSGTLAFVIARFHSAASAEDDPRLNTYGMTEIRPGPDDPRQRSIVRVTIFRHRRRRAPRWLDRLDATIRRNFVRAFLESDVRLLDGVRYQPSHLIAADQIMIDYLRWLAPISRGELAAPTSFSEELS